MSDADRQAIAVALVLLAEAMEDGNEHLMPGRSTAEMRALAALHWQFEREG